MVVGVEIWAILMDRKPMATGEVMVKMAIEEVLLKIVDTEAIIAGAMEVGVKAIMDKKLVAMDMITVAMEVVMAGNRTTMAIEDTIMMATKLMDVVVMLTQEGQIAILTKVWKKAIVCCLFFL